MHSTRFLPETGATGLSQPVFGSRTASSLVRRRPAGTQAAFRPRVPHAVPAQPSNVRAFAAHVFSRTPACRFFLSVQTWILVCSRHVRISFFCQTGFLNGRSDLACPWPGRTSSRFSQDACVIYLIKRDVYKIGSSSKRGCLLWIRPIFFTGSRVYVLFDVPDKPCIALASKVYRFWKLAIVGVSAHSFLWICMGLSTPWMPAGWLLPTGLLFSCQKKREQAGREANQDRSDAYRQQSQRERKKNFAHPRPAASQVYNQ
jgi:hypothetical protein